MFYTIGMMELRLLKFFKPSLCLYQHESTVAKN